MKNKHTSGPWGRFDKFESDAATDFPCTVVTAPNGCPIAYVGNHGDYKINANLISAAPDLFEIVLEVAADGLHPEDERGECLCSHCERTRKARAVIARARGEK